MANIDPRDKTLTLENGAQVRVGPSTRITKDGSAASFADIIPGDDVRASYSSPKGAQELTVTSEIGSTAPAGK